MIKKKISKKNNVIDFPAKLSQIEKEIEWFNNKQPSSENLVMFIWEKINPLLKDAILHRIRLRETPTIFTDYYGPQRDG